MHPSQSILFCFPIKMKIVSRSCGDCRHPTFCLGILTVTQKGAVTVDQERERAGATLLTSRGWALVAWAGEGDKFMAALGDQNSRLQEKEMRGGREERGWGEAGREGREEGSISLYTQRLHNQIDNAFSFCPLSSIELKLLGTQLLQLAIY